MPITLRTPIKGPVVTRQEISSFTVDIDGGIVVMNFADITESGEVVGQTPGESRLFLPDGRPRFSPQLYADIKAMLYRLAMEDGIVDGTVE